jgi:putative tryptophan/tyrosine transport system substrate-binding protein
MLTPPARALRPQIPEILSGLRGDTRRREFIALVGGVMAIWPFAALGQQGKVPVIGILTTNSSTLTPELAAFQKNLSDLGYVVGSNLAMTIFGSDNRPERLPSLATELVKQKVDVIFCTGSEAAVAAKQATASIPIVMLSKDPVGVGLVASHAHPGGNITGLDLPPVDGKRVELLKELIPGIARIAAIWDPDDRAAVAPLGMIVAAAQTLGMEVQRLEVRDASAFEVAFDAAARDGAQAVLAVGTPLFGAQVVRIAELALRQRMPTMFYASSFPHAGGLISYGPDFAAIFRRLAYYVHRILMGAKPGDLPVELPTKFDLVINLRTAKALDLTVPQLLLAQADEVIE